MADSFTAKLNLTKPEVGASTDTWGGKLNSNLDDIDALFDTGPYLKLSKGGTGAGTASDARTNLGLGSLAVKSAVSSSDITDGTIVQADLSSTVPLVPVGSIMPYAGTSEPTGWLLCYGQAISRTTYAALFAVVGTVYGSGDGSTTFNLPDLRGRVIAGQDDMGGSSANRLTGVTGSVDGDVLGGSGGTETHTLTVAEMPSHGHKIADGTGGAGTNTWPEGTAGIAGMDTQTGNYVTSGALIQHIENTGGGGAHNNVQPTFILNYIIRT